MRRIQVDDLAKRDLAALRVDPLAGEACGRERPQPLRGVAAVNLEEFERRREVHPVGGKVRDERVLVVTDEERKILRRDPAHPVRRDQVAIEQVNHDLLDAPDARRDAGVEV